MGFWKEDEAFQGLLHSHICKTCSMYYFLKVEPQMLDMQILCLWMIGVLKCKENLMKV